ncbi:MAG: hypothetical protein IPQ05_06080 [Leptospiraceae bacterium]|nr:hypothetical protein [Leptospiraceae bacterium]
MLSECRFQTTDDKKKSIKSNESTKLMNELIKAELIQIDRFELIDDFVIDKTLNQIKLKQQCGQEDCELQLGKILFADYIIFCYSSIEISRILSGIDNFGVPVLLDLEQEILKVKLNLYDMKNGKYLLPATFDFSSRDFYLKKYKDKGLAKASTVEPFLESKYPEQTILNNYLTNFSESIQFNKDSENIQTKEIVTLKYKRNSRVLLIGKNGGYEKDWNDINHKLIKDLSKDYEIIDEEAKKKALKQLVAQQKCGVEDCGISISKLLNADYTVDLSIINDLEFIFDVKSKDNRRIQYYKSKISDYNDYRFSFRDCIGNADCLQTASPYPESETKNGVLKRPKILISFDYAASIDLNFDERWERSYMPRLLQNYISENFEVISKEAIAKAMEILEKQKKCEYNCKDEDLLILLKPDYLIRFTSSQYQIFKIDKVKSLIYKGEKSTYNRTWRYWLYRLYWVNDCLKNGICKKLSTVEEIGETRDWSWR